MKKVILITSQFPYAGGEQFLETEVKYYHNVELTIVPKSKTGDIRDIPKNIIVDDFLVKNTLAKSQITYLLKSLKNKLFYKELFSESFFSSKKIKIFLSSIYRYQMYYEILDRYFFEFKDTKNITVYTYWNDEITYALQSLKDKYHYRLVSRIHRGDLYKEVKPFSYMPLKKHFTGNIDTLYSITQSANSYLEDIYGFDKKNIKLSRLGVDNRQIITKSSEIKSLNIVSCSFLTEVKQVDKIIRSLKIIATQMEKISFNWTHIGDGVLYDELVVFAKNELDSLKNIKYNFVGNYKNKQVYDFYAQHRIDVFLNVSLSEGVPVSIMEAMSCHIPIVAPNIGGIKDMLVDGTNGFLLSSECLVDEIVFSLKDISFFKKKEVREKSYEIFLEKYDANENYVEFIQDIIKKA